MSRGLTTRRCIELRHPEYDGCTIVVSVKRPKTSSVLHIQHIIGRYMQLVGDVEDAETAWRKRSELKDEHMADYQNIIDDLASVVSQCITGISVIEDSEERGEGDVIASKLLDILDSKMSSVSEEERSDAFDAARDLVERLESMISLLEKESPAKGSGKMPFIDYDSRVWEELMPEEKHNACLEHATILGWPIAFDAVRGSTPQRLGKSVAPRRSVTTTA